MKKNSKDEVSKFDSCSEFVEIDQDSEAQPDDITETRVTEIYNQYNDKKKELEKKNEEFEKALSKFNDIRKALKKFESQQNFIHESSPEFHNLKCDWKKLFDDSESLEKKLQEISNEQKIIEDDVYLLEEKMSQPYFCSLHEQQIFPDIKERSGHGGERYMGKRALEERNVAIKYDNEKNVYVRDADLYDVFSWAPRPEELPTRQDVLVVRRLVLRAIGKSKSKGSQPASDLLKELRFEFFEQFLACREPSKIEKNLGLDSGYVARQLTTVIKLFGKEIIEVLNNHDLPCSFTERILRRKNARYIRLIDRLERIGELWMTFKEERKKLSKKKVLEYKQTLRTSQYEILPEWLSDDLLKPEIDILMKACGDLGGGGKKRSIKTLAEDIKIQRVKHPNLLKSANYLNELMNIVRSYEVEEWLNALMSNKKKSKQSVRSQEAVDKTVGYRKFKSIWLGALEHEKKEAEDESI